MIFHHFDRFLTEYESRFEREYGFFRPIIKEVVESYLDCGNPRCGFARIRCPDCGEERFVMFSCRTRGSRPSCHAKRLEEWAERILSWRHTGFNVHSHIFIARVTSHIPDKAQVMVRYYGLYANGHRGKARKAGLSPLALRMSEKELKPVPSKNTWRPQRPRSNIFHDPLQEQWGGPGDFRLFGHRCWLPSRLSALSSHP